ncbi:DsrE family protein [Anaerobacillus sp. HL2]|nr:DsrE family protein [Anaerobacillus sp. HL2]
MIHDSPYGNERPYNGLRLAMSHIKKNTGVKPLVFLTGDAVICIKTTTDTKWIL